LLLNIVATIFLLVLLSSNISINFPSLSEGDCKGKQLLQLHKFF